MYFHISHFGTWPLRRTVNYKVYIFYRADVNIILHIILQYTDIHILLHRCTIHLHILLHRCTYPISQVYISYYTNVHILLHNVHILLHRCTYPIVHSLLHMGTYPVAQVYISYNTNVNTLLHKFKYPINQVYAPPEWVGEHHYNGEALSVWELGTQHIFLKVQNL